MDIDELVTIERKFLVENDAIQNSHGVYLYKSADGNESLSLDMYLYSYREWLIENKYVEPTNKIK